jgi:hypothetical protein
MTVTGSDDGRRGVARVTVKEAARVVGGMCSQCPGTGLGEVCDDCSEWLWLEEEPIVTVRSDEPMFGRAIHRQGLVCQ